MGITGQSQVPAVEDVGREMTNLSCLTCSASERNRGHRTKRIIEDMREPPITIGK